MKKLADFVNRACSSLAWEAVIIGGVAATAGGGKFMIHDWRVYACVELAEA